VTDDLSLGQTRSKTNRSVNLSKETVGFRTPAMDLVVVRARRLSADSDSVKFRLHVMCRTHTYHLDNLDAMVSIYDRAHIIHLNTVTIKCLKLSVQITLGHFSLRVDVLNY